MNVDAPAPRNMAQEGRESLQAQVDLAPDTYANRAKYDPLYTDLQTQTVRQALLGSDQSPGMLSTLEQVAPRIQALTDSAQNQQRTQDVEALRTLGPQAVQALRNADPMQAALIARLNQEASSGLDSGASVDPSLAHTIGQQFRSRAAANGLGFGLSDAVGEAFALGETGNRLRQQRQQFAQGIAGVNAATGADPALAILGRPSQAAGGAQSFLGQGQSNAGGRGAPDFNPFNAYGSDLFNTNYNAAAAADIAGANATSSIIGGGLSAL